MSRWLGVLVGGATSLGLFVAAPAQAGTVEVITPEGPLRPGLPGTVHVLAVDAGGRAFADAPELSVPNGSLRALPGASGAPEVHAYRVVPPLGSKNLQIEVFADGERHQVSLPVAAPPVGELVAPKRMDVVAGAAEVVFRLTGPDLPPAHALQVAPGEGVLLGVAEEPGALVVRIRPDESQYPRVVPVLFRDARTADRPVVSAYRVWTRPRIALQTEPGVSMNIRVGPRTYGPALADADGIAALLIDHYPGELVADAVLKDDVGNETSASLPLANQAQAMLAMLAEGAWVPGQAPPLVWLRGVHGDGHPWEGREPACQSALLGVIQPVQVEPGLWALPLDVDPSATASELRLYCRLGTGSDTVLKVPTVEAYPTRLSLRVFPDDPSTAFPVSEVYAVLEDQFGARLPIDGVRVSALRGEVALAPTEGVIARAEYRGNAALESGYDIVIAQYDRPPGSGVVGAVRVSHGRVEADGVMVFGRALDQQGRPLTGVDLALSCGDATLFGTTDARGWASARLPLPPDGAPLRVSARSQRRSAFALAARDAYGTLGPAAPDLEVRHTVRFLSGRVADVQMSVEPPILYTGGTAFARVSVILRDRGGAAVNGVVPELTVSEGFLGAVQPDGDGRYIADYTPPPGERARVVRVVATAEGQSSREVELVLEPRPLQRLAVGGGIGVLTNFAEMASFAVLLDADVDIPRLSALFRARLLLRVGVGWYGDEAFVESTNGGDRIDLNLNVVPLTLGVVARREQGGKAIWVGSGPMLAPHAVATRFGDHTLPLGVGVWPGIALIGGAGRRIGPGEAFGELRWAGLVASGGEVAWRGQVGGLMVLSGYRVLY